MKQASRIILMAGLPTGLLLGLPLLGIALAGRSIDRYLEFPPTTHYVEHAAFAWPAFIGMAIILISAIAPFLIRLTLGGGCPGVPEPVQPPARRFPWWGWCGVAFGLIAWHFAWTRYSWFDPLQPFTFSPLWFAYILVVNALTFKRSGTCMLTERPKHLALLFVFSAAFWWFFEYLNRFVQNWYYEGIGALTPRQYFIFATLPFSTVLPAVMGTYEWLATFPRLSAGLTLFPPITITRPRLWAITTLTVSAAGLGGIGILPDLLFPLLWLAPLLIVTSLQVLQKRDTVLSGVEHGDWSRIFLLAVAALICGFFWEMWNFHSQAKWIYAVPYVNRFHIFEMPILGYAGYLPFGLECAAVAALAENLLLHHTVLKTPPSQNTKG